MRRIARRLILMCRAAGPMEQHRRTRTPHEFLGDAAEEHPCYAPTPVGSHGDQID
jgi:hypothetical protein